MIKGFEDVVLFKDNAIMAVGEFKAPFSALSQDASLSLHNQALSHSYAEMQGFMATNAPALLVQRQGSVGTETAAAAVASSTDNVITDTRHHTGGAYPFLLMDLSYICPLGPRNRGEANDSLPPVYASGDSTILNEEYFTHSCCTLSPLFPPVPVSTSHRPRPLSMSWLIARKKRMLRTIQTTMSSLVLYQGLVIFLQVTPTMQLRRKTAFIAS